MRIILIILFIAAVGLAVFGFYTQSTNEAQGHLFIGLGVATLFFLWMPTFVYHRWKNKKVEDYMLNKENIYKMRNYTNNKKL
ncbi:hypothetical protein [Patiriisocius marinus]|uniref:Uncharacterized protein n=1 Tax=Patiriisocius marinus TaxID=1397112 RepID=A0A5J4IUJ0_9FLAO|nr:hypothetical protein [Patiriisocius marinus]GER58394.1 hypothetical protein ULMA_05020 [Patiriisocius marinus]